MGGSHSPNSRSRGACRGGATLQHRKDECDGGSWDPVETALCMVLATADDLQQCRRGGTWTLQSVRTHGKDAVSGTLAGTWLLPLLRANRTACCANLVIL